MRPPIAEDVDPRLDRIAAAAYLKFQVEALRKIPHDPNEPSAPGPVMAAMDDDTPRLPRNKGPASLIHSHRSREPHGRSVLPSQLAKAALLSAN